MDIPKIKESVCKEKMVSYTCVCLCIYVWNIRCIEMREGNMHEEIFKTS